jgi:hypothetical protein
MDDSDKVLPFQRDPLPITELGDFFVLHQLLQISSGKARRILERLEDSRTEDRLSLEKIAAGLDLMENLMRRVMRRA